MKLAALELWSGSCARCNSHKNELIQLLRFFQGSQCLGLLVLTTRLAFGRLEQLLVRKVHDLPFWSLHAFENGLARGMPIHLQ